MDKKKKAPLILDQNGVNNLREGIVKRAVGDYVLAMLGSKIDQKKPVDVMHEIEYFFRSAWFRTLTAEKIDGEACIKVCQEQGQYAIWRRDHKCSACKVEKCVHRGGTHFTAKKVCQKDKNLSEKD